MRYFTPDTANRTLPLVRRITSDLVGLQFEVTVRGERITRLSDSQRGLEATAAHAEELADMRSSLEADRARMRAIEKELSELGVLIHSATAGAVDFPARLNGVEVRLCWCPGDDSVKFWHLAGVKVAERQLIGGLVFDTPPPKIDDSDNGTQSDPRQSLRS